MDSTGWIVLAGPYRLDRIGIDIGFERRTWILCAGWFFTGWIVWMDWMCCSWDRGGVEGPALAGTRTGELPLVLERERHHWLLRVGRRWEVVAGTNCVGATRARSICVGIEK